MLNFIPGLSTIKYYIMAGLGFLSIILYALLQSNKKEFAQAKLNGLKQARKVEKETFKTMKEGLKNEKEALDKVGDGSNRHDLN